MNKIFFIRVEILMSKRNPYSRKLFVQGSKFKVQGSRFDVPDSD